MDKFLEKKRISRYNFNRLEGRNISEGIVLQELQRVFLKDFVDGFLNKSVDELLKDFLEKIVKEFLDDFLENFLTRPGT